MNLVQYLEKAKLETVNQEQIANIIERKKKLMAAGLSDLAIIEDANLDKTMRMNKVIEVVAKGPRRYWIKTPGSFVYDSLHDCEIVLKQRLVLKRSSKIAIAILCVANVSIGIASALVEPLMSVFGLFNIVALPAFFMLTDDHGGLRQRISTNLSGQIVEHWREVIPEKAIDILVEERKKQEFGSYGIWRVQERIQEEHPRSMDPVLVGIPKETRDVVALLYAWGEDLQEIDTALQSQK